MRAATGRPIAKESPAWVRGFQYPVSNLLTGDCTERLPGHSLNADYDVWFQKQDPRVPPGDGHLRGPLVRALGLAKARAFYSAFIAKGARRGTRYCTKKGANFFNHWVVAVTGPGG
jgi:hypothetical protein